MCVYVLVRPQVEPWLIQNLVLRVAPEQNLKDEYFECVQPLCAELLPHHLT